MMAGEQLLLFLMLTFTLGAAAEPSVSDSAAPSTDMLEFLGTFETEDGDWIDPLDLAQMKPEDLSSAEKELSPDANTTSGTKKVITHD